MGASESTPATPDLLPKVSAQDTRVLQEMSPHDKMQLESALHQQQKVADREIQEILRTAKTKSHSAEKQQASLVPSELSEKERSDLMSVPPSIALQAQKKIDAALRAHKQNTKKLVQKEAQKANRTHFLYGPSHTDDNFNWVKGHTLLQYPEATVRRLGDVRAVISGLGEPDLKKLVRFFTRSIDNMDAEVKDGTRIVVRIANTVHQDIQKSKKSADRKKMLEDIKKVGKPAKSAFRKVFQDPYGYQEDPLTLRHVQAPSEPLNIGLQQVRARVQRLKQLQESAQVLQSVHDMFEAAERKYAQDAQSTQDIHHLFQKYEGIVQRLQETEKVEGVADLFEEAEAQVALLKKAKKMEDKEKLNKAVHALQPLVAKSKKVAKKGAKGSPASTVLGAEAKVIGAIQKKAECDEWALDKTHNPFNPTNKGRKLSPTGPTAKAVTAYCTDPVKFCSGKHGATAKRVKFCL